MRPAKSASTRLQSSGKRNRVQERWAQRGFSPADLLNLWQPNGACEEYSGLAYGKGPRQKLDVYRPRHAAKAPVLVFFYGGSWQRGSRDLYRFVGASRAAQGIVTVVPDYSIFPPARFPMFVEDAARAVRFARERSPVLSENSIRPRFPSEERMIASLRAMFAILHALGMFVADLFKSRSRLEAENLFLRHQLTIALRRAPPRLRLRGSDRALLIWMTQIWPSLLGAAQVVQPETILRWHRTGLKAFWRWKSRNRVGRPKIDRGLRDLIQRMSRENP